MNLCTIKTLRTFLLWITPMAGCDPFVDKSPDDGGGGSGTDDGDDGSTATEGSGTGVACTADAKMCPDGSWVGRVEPDCEFAPCPEDVCTKDAMLCPDGTVVGRIGPDCEFAPCPPCTPGDKTTAPDGCNDCFCQDDGSWACTLRACDPCAPQDAKGIGVCEVFLGFAWNGSGCEIVSGCTCEGTDCDALHESLEDCQASVPDCQGPGCGGWLGPCPDAEHQWCDFPDGSTCGAADESGTCRSRPDACDDVLAPVCGCDETTYDNACMANLKGVDVVHEGRCWDPCADKVCGDECRLCAPDDPQCVEPAVVNFCDLYGQCSPEAPVCKDPLVDGCAPGEIWAEPSCQDPPHGDYVTPNPACYVPCETHGDTCPKGTTCQVAWIETLCPCPPKSEACCDACGGGEAQLCL